MEIPNRNAYKLIAIRAATIPDFHDTDTYHDSIATIPKVSRYLYASRLKLNS